MKRWNLVLPCLVLFCRLFCSPAPGFAQNTGDFKSYRNHQQVSAFLKSLQSRNTQSVALHNIGQSPGGREVTIIEIGRDLTTGPAIFVAANFDGITPLETEGALFLAQFLVDYTDQTVKEYIKYGDWLGAKRDEAFFTKPRILIRQIVSGNPPRIFASYTEDALYFTQIGFGIISKDNLLFDNKFLLILLNSNLMNYYHKYKFLDIEKELFQKILIANCKRFPIKNISLELQAPFIAKADQMLSLNKELQETLGKFHRSLEREFGLEKLSTKLQNWQELPYADFLKELAKAKISLSLTQKAEWEEYFLAEQQKAQNIQHQITTTDREIDQMVYDLYELTEEERKIVES